jgi:hypothetical protein
MSGEDGNEGMTGMGANDCDVAVAESKTISLERRDQIIGRLPLDYRGALQDGRYDTAE